MRTGRSYGMVALLLLAGLVLAGCQEVSPGSDAVADARPAVVEPSADGRPARVTLTARAEAELGLRTATVTPTEEGGLAVPFGAVVYDSEGATWAFVPVAPHSYRRAPISIGAVAGQRARLTSGLSAGAEVVSVGAAFLWGAEQEISGGE